MRPAQGQALDRLDIAVAGGSEVLTDAVNEASMVRSLQAQGQIDPQDLLAAARSDYARILAAMYARGHYSVDIRITVDGREAAAIPALEAPASHPFHPDCGRSRPALPLRPGAGAAAGQRNRVADKLPDRGRGRKRGGQLCREHCHFGLARSGACQGLCCCPTQWLPTMRRGAIDADVRLDPGPRLRFGRLEITGQDRMRRGPDPQDRWPAPKGKPSAKPRLRRRETRLRRTGIFASVALTER